MKKFVQKAKPLSYVLIYILIIIFFFISLSNYLDYPVVYKSHSTKECVTVVSPNNIFSCDNLPEHYHLIWVE